MVEAVEMVKMVKLVERVELVGLVELVENSRREYMFIATLVVNFFPILKGLYVKTLHNTNNPFRIGAFWCNVLYKHIILSGFLKFTRKG